MKVLKYMIISIAFTSFNFIQAQESKLPEIKFYFFYAKDCENCHIAIKEVFPPLNQKYNLHMKSLDIDELKNYKLLLKLEEKYNDTDNEVPCVVIGEHILGGKEEIQDSLEKILQEYKQNGCDFPDAETKRDTTNSLSVKEVYLAYFYARKCKECDRATYELKYLGNKYPNLAIKRFNIDIPEGKKLNEALCELYEVPQEKRLVAPMVFIGEEFLIQKEVNNKRIEALIEKYTPVGTKVPWEETKKLKEKSERNIRERFNTMSVFSVFFAGLVDGVNPCAFATILFFISFLSFTGKKGREILLVGASFTCAVFIVYFLIGIGIFSFVKNLTFIPIIRKVLFSIMGILSIIFGVLSIYDYFKIRKGSYEEVKLQLPGFLKRRIHIDIREKMQMRNYILAALVTGVLVSISEFVCTGQVYLPTITFITSQISSLKIKGLTYLFLYNFAFIIPLVVVFSAAYKGTTSAGLNLFWKRYGAVSKLAISVLFFLLGGLLIFYAYH